MIVSARCHSHQHAALISEFVKVFSESWQLRSQLKADIRVQVRNLKALLPDTGTHRPRSPHKVQASIREQISSWTSDGSYLHDTVSNSVCTPVSTKTTHTPF